MSGRQRSRLLGLAGWLLALASLAFLIVVASERRAEIAQVALSSGQWLAIGGLAAVYGASLFLLAAAWHCLLRFLGAVAGRPRRSIHAFTTSQLAKFVPGNVFHIVGRHLIHRADGVADGKLALASLIEVALMALAAGTVVAGAATVAPPRALGTFVASLAPYLLVALVLVAVVVLAVVRRYGRGSVLWLLASFAAYLIFFTAMAAIVAALVGMLAPVSAWLVGGVGVAAWLVGFVTPGAPAGMGTREAAMLALAGGVVPPGALVIGVALFRLVTLLGDVLCFAVGHLLFRKG